MVGCWLICLASNYRDIGGSGTLNESKGDEENLKKMEHHNEENKVNEELTSKSNNYRLMSGTFSKGLL